MLFSFLCAFKNLKAKQMFEPYVVSFTVSMWQHKSYYYVTHICDKLSVLLSDNWPYQASHANI